jgi:hypothetical protein
MYWTYKMLVLKFYSKTNQFADDLSEQFLNCLILGSVVHGLIMTYWMSRVDYFEQDSNHLVLYAFGWAVFLAAYLAKASVITWLIKLMKFMYYRLSNKVMVHPRTISQDVLQEMKITALVSLLKKAKKDLENAKNLD